MKKKYKDITIGEMAEICEKHSNCIGCPLCGLECVNIVDKEYLDQEIEL